MHIIISSYYKCTNIFDEIKIVYQYMKEKMNVHLLKYMICVFYCCFIPAFEKTS